MERLDQKQTAPMWFVYIIQTSDELFYTGITTDVKRRWDEHNTSNKGAKFFRGRQPKQLMFVNHYSDRSSASKMEAKIKSLTRKQKTLLISSAENKLETYFSDGLCA